METLKILCQTILMHKLRNEKATVFQEHYTRLTTKTKSIIGNTIFPFQVKQVKPRFAISSKGLRLWNRFHSKFENLRKKAKSYTLSIKNSECCFE